MHADASVDKAMNDRSAMHCVTLSVSPPLYAILYDVGIRTDASVDKAIDDRCV